MGGGVGWGNSGCEHGRIIPEVLCLILDAVYIFFILVTVLEELCNKSGLVRKIIQLFLQVAALVLLVSCRLIIY